MLIDANRCWLAGIYHRCEFNLPFLLLFTVKLKFSRETNRFQVARFVTLHLFFLQCIEFNEFSLCQHLEHLSKIKLVIYENFILFNYFLSNRNVPKAMPFAARLRENKLNRIIHQSLFLMTNPLNIHQSSGKINYKQWKGLVSRVVEM